MKKAARLEQQIIDNQANNELINKFFALHDEVINEISSILN